MSREEFRPKSLTQHFLPPTGYRGRFGWVCGYSADEHFLNLAAERFVEQTDNQRAQEGTIVLAVMLDPGEKQKTLSAVPGVLHLGFNAEDKPFKLMHAKVALLSFRDKDDNWHLRLLVSTGNWTRQTLEESFDLVWRLDLTNQDMKEGGETVAQARADIKAAWEFLAYLRPLFQTELLNANRDTSLRIIEFEKWINEIKDTRRKPRFFDNREKSLLDQLPRMVESNAQDKRRNYLAMGSGFFEGAGKEGTIPTVLERTVSRLREARLLTEGSDIHLYVNPVACQSVASSVESINEAGWRIVKATTPEFFGKNPRTLHAKFLFSANQKSASNRLTIPWVYLGSGNLTRPGFVNHMNAEDGNLEAGVVFGCDNLNWEKSRDIDDQCIVTNLLPIQRDGEGIIARSELNAGEEMPDRPIAFMAAPISYFKWTGDDGSGWLLPEPNLTPGDLKVMQDGQPIERDADKGFRWHGGQPREAMVHWNQDGVGRQASVPIVDTYGRIAAALLQPLELDDAWWQLAAFPDVPDEDDLPRDVGDGLLSKDNGRARGNRESPQYPARRMMQLIENIADKQTAIPKADWSTWCNRLEQCLALAKGDEVVAYFRDELKLNPLEPLFHDDFRPDFAIDRECMESKRYEEVLNRIETEWKMTAQQARIGEERR